MLGNPIQTPTLPGLLPQVQPLPQASNPMALGQQTPPIDTNLLAQGMAQAMPQAAPARQAMPPSQAATGQAPQVNAPAVTAAPMVGAPGQPRPTWNQLMSQFGHFLTPPKTDATPAASPAAPAPQQGGLLGAVPNAVHSFLGVLGL